MKKKYLSLALCLLTMSGCDYLDFDQSDGKTEEEAFAYFSSMTSMGTSGYSKLPVDWGVMGGALRESASDNAMYTWSTSGVYDMYNDNWSPTNIIDNQWDNFYIAIRDINNFLEKYDEKSLERFKWSSDYNENLTKLRMTRNESRALRAYYYFELIKRYGDVPFTTTTLTTAQANSIGRTSFDDIVKFIVDECDAVSGELPISYTNFVGTETGRVTAGAAKAIKARTLLYAASPLHNPTGDKSKYIAAAKAAYDIIDDGTYSLQNINVDPLYSANGAQDVLNSKQLIFERRSVDETNNYEQYNLPIGLTGNAQGGKSGNTPTQNLVDAFDMKDGSEFSWDNSYDVENMYYDANGKETRDPRFYKKIVCNGSSIMGQKINTSIGGANGQPIEGATYTGYYLRALMNETVSLNTTGIKKKHHNYPTFRYAEVLLNYAEAMDAAYGADVTAEGLPLTARQALNQVRAAANMPNIEETGEEFTSRIKNERRVELAFEDHRFWDIRRWKCGDLVKDIYGVEITNDGGTLSYKKVKVQSRVWDDKMYYYPIPDTELFKNKNLTQNPGWGK